MLLAKKSAEGAISYIHDLTEKHSGIYEEIHLHLRLEALLIV
jgi:hypothetical protein